jgi:hypothetical protein
LWKVASEAALAVTQNICDKYRHDRPADTETAEFHSGYMIIPTGDDRMDLFINNERKCRSEACAGNRYD